LGQIGSNGAILCFFTSSSSSLLERMHSALWWQFPVACVIWDAFLFWWWVSGEVGELLIFIFSNFICSDFVVLNKWNFYFWIAEPERTQQ